MNAQITPEQTALCLLRVLVADLKAQGFCTEEEEVNAADLVDYINDVFPVLEEAAS